MHAKAGAAVRKLHHVKNLVLAESDATWAGGHTDGTYSWADKDSVHHVNFTCLRMYGAKRRQAALQYAAEPASCCWRS